MGEKRLIRPWETALIAVGGISVPLLGSALVVWTIWLSDARALMGLGIGSSLVILTVGYAVYSVAPVDRPVTLASWVTLARGSALIALSGFFFISLPDGGLIAWAPAVLFGLAAGLDGVDGQIARRRDASTPLGARLDGEMDALTVLFGSILVVLAGLAHWGILTAGAAKYVFSGGIRWRERRGLTVYDLDENRLRKAIAATFMLSVWIALFPVTGTRVAYWMTGLATVPLLAHFLRDWLVVCGRWH